MLVPPEQILLGWPKKRRRKKKGSAQRVLEDVSLGDPARQPPSSDHHWDLGCVSIPFLWLVCKMVFCVDRERFSGEVDFCVEDDK